ncbi:porin [Escherichia coli]|uniref:porin n=1 Tax=Escherichia coli TaxID=562 RepID=UPI002358CDFB|nr:porin [Escherichia coli]MDC9105785.1 porin [Escherichia coli]
MNIYRAVTSFLIIVQKRAHDEKKLTVAISAVAASVLMAMSAQAAEIYNKDSNKLDLYGKVNAKHYFSSNDADDGDTTYARLGFKGETQIQRSTDWFRSVGI